MRIRMTLVLLLMTGALSGCFFAVGAAAGAASAVAAYNHRTIEKVMKDQNLGNEIYNRMRSHADIYESSHLDATVFNQVVLLTGETPRAEWKDQIAEEIKQMPEVKKVYNQILVQNPSSALTRTSDTWITTKIKSQMVSTKELKASEIKVVTANGAVYLMGIVNEEQANIAVDIARNVSGVQRVVKMFQPS